MIRTHSLLSNYNNSLAVYMDKPNFTFFINLKTLKSN